MYVAKLFALVLTVSALLLYGGTVALSQPLLREGEPEESQQHEEPDAEEIQRRELAHEKARLEEDRRMKLQEELMRLQGEQLLAEREEIARRDRMMRYALLIAIGVIATTLLITYARSRVAEEDGKQSGD
jgi:flagellar biosynthesis/type III secretory pathway M-ring protein FliF/YscJ